MSQPKPEFRTLGAEAIAYRGAMVAAMMRRLASPPLPDDVQNAFVQSALTDLRALIGFLLAHADDLRRDRKGKFVGIRQGADDVKPGWYLPHNDTWVPRGVRRRRALYAFFEPVSAHLAHVVIRTKVHPGAWPIVEAAKLVGEDLGAFLDVLQNRAPAEAARFSNAQHPLPQVVGALTDPSFTSYPAPHAERMVRRARELLRTQLGWPKV
jgi:hypothetical protein